MRGVFFRGIYNLIFGDGISFLLQIEESEISFGILYGVLLCKGNLYWIQSY